MVSGHRALLLLVRDIMGKWVKSDQEVAYMKALFIGGTGTISTAITEMLAQQGCELYLINRGNRNDELPAEVNVLQADINDEARVAELIADLEFDVVADFIAFVPSQLERDYRLFKDKTKQFIFISSASAYQTPLADYRITEGTPLSNPFWSIRAIRLPVKTI